MRWLYAMFQMLFIVSPVRSRRAFLDITLYEINEDDGRYTMRRIGITGEFSNAGTVSTAEGDIIQIHPHSLCEDFEDGEKYDYGWVGVVKLPYHGADQCHLVEKARRAVGQGATAVIFDVSDHPDALHQLNERPLFTEFNQPIVLVKGIDATELMNIINGEHIARAVIKRGQPDQGDPNSHFSDPALFVIGVLLFLAFLCIGFLKVRCRKRHQQTSLHNWTIRHSTTKKYKKSRKRYDAVPQVAMAEENSWGASDRSSSTLCAICLESFRAGQDLRVLECQHEFHIDCIDVWLTQKRSCPLCNRSFSSLSTKHHSAAQRNEDSVLRTAVDRAPSFEDRTEMQHIATNSSDIYQSATSYGTIPLHQSEDVASQYVLSNFCSRTQGISDAFVSSNAGASNAAHNLHGSPILHKGKRSVFDHKDSVLRSHRKRNPRRSTLSEEVQNTEVNSTSTPRTKLQNDCHGTQDYIRQNCDQKYLHQDLVVDTDSSCTEQSIACGNNCNCRVNGASDTSIFALRGSIPLLKSSSSFFSSSLSNTSKYVEYSSDPPIIAESEFVDQHLIRSPTPCIEYSSSDGASNLCWLSYSTLEDVLGAIESGNSGLSS